MRSRGELLSAPKTASPSLATRNLQPVFSLGLQFLGVSMLLAPIAVPSLLFDILGRRYLLTRGILNLDYSIVAFGGTLLPAYIFVPCYVVTVIMDLSVSVAPLFGFSAYELTKGIWYLPFLIHRPLVFELLSIALALISIGLFAHSIHGTLYRRINARVAYLVLSMVLFNIGIEHPIGVSTDRRLVSYYIAYSPARQVFRAFRTPQPRESIEPNSDVHSASFFLDHLIDRHKQLPNIVLVIVESLGHMLPTQGQSQNFGSGLAPELDRVLEAVRLSGRYSVQTGLVPFHGLTTAGEFRELCHAQVHTLTPESVVFQSQGCLPMKLGTLGFQTIAYHGFSGAFFQRDVWYPQLGFQEAYFGPQLAAQGLTVCREPFFSGICDYQIPQVIGQRLLRSPTKNFVYWLTLNSHLPVGRPPADNVRREHDTSSFPEAVQWLTQWHQLVFSSLVKLALQPHLPPTGFIIVGDHAPPFVDRQVHGLFDQSSVPYVVIWPHNFSHDGD
jgi:phosphoglycerol transferase MdoB-like AlkP superfamily enzyme